MIGIDGVDNRDAIRVRQVLSTKESSRLIKRGTQEVRRLGPPRIGTEGDTRGLTEPLKQGFVCACTRARVCALPFTPSDASLVVDRTRRAPSERVDA